LHLKEDLVADDKKKVIIKYVNNQLISQHSARPIEVSEELANRYVERGWAKILSTFPDANPDLLESEIDELKAKYEKDSVKYCFEDKWLDKVAFVTGGLIPLALRKYGDGCGFTISQVSPINFSPGKLCLNDLIILSTKLTGFTDIQKLKLNVVLFQRGLSFCLYVEDHLLNDEQTRHYLMRCKVAFFTEEDYVAEALDLMGDAIEDKIFIVSDEAGFWKKVNSLGEKK
jgi:hypothetical protein